MLVMSCLAATPTIGSTWDGYFLATASICRVRVSLHLGPWLLVIGYFYGMRNMLWIGFCSYLQRFFSGHNCSDTNKSPAWEPCHRLVHLPVIRLSSPGGRNMLCPNVVCGAPTLFVVSTKKICEMIHLLKIHWSESRWFLSVRKVAITGLLHDCIF